MAAFYLDHNVHRGLAQLLRTGGHDAVATHEISLERATDDVQLLTAAEHGWIMVTHNRKDFVLLHRAWRRWSRAWNVTPEHAGVVILPQGRPHTDLKDLLNGFLEQGLPLFNELYEWRAGEGWIRRR